MFRKPTVQIGDRFVKLGSFNTGIWIVAGIFQIPSEPPHARLQKEGVDYDTLTISVPTLIDPNFFKKVG